MATIKGPRPEDFLEAADGAKIAALLPYMEAELSQAINAVQNRAGQLILHGELSPELAQNLWYELYSYKKLLKSLQTRVNMGASVREELGRTLKPLGESTNG